ncbi:MULTISPECIES: DUF6571 family protein [Streptomyces]|uniref:AG2 protein n=1 Tax=Streptomyces thermoviolaceus subsp. thermoviolaceus TaxID=66860 RepID=A0ABX0YXX3_STRTL|nr:DUF6571 family protein [Streptomyces thermoviolaceus]NJP16867.1 hypothetical protein [Streptomyces thermoviolaceus subsp. thermoviolaceus]WTD47140.1 hypothetical protein OG899_06175 [Streptomyces thermoviolaceus]GHB11942.1 hypothetical protein GCM10010512_49220 [Streptomyces thermoviolaceus subsp. thermoviolaceus]
MLDFQTLYNADLSQLSEAVASWGKAPEKFKDAGTKYRNTVEKDLQGADWDGEAASAAVDKLKVVEKQLDAAADEAEDIHKLLQNAYDIFTSARSKLRRLKEDVEKDKNLSIKPDGEVYLDPPEGTENTAVLHKAYQETIHTYNNSIKSTLQTAQDADDVLFWALSQDHNGHDQGFDSSGYTSIDAARTAKAQADQDLKELLQLAGTKSKLMLAGSGNPVDLATLQQINTLLSRHEGDPYFAEKFATQLGAKGTLEFWTRIADRTQYGDERTKTSAAIQQSLGYTLATASHSDSKDMTKWKNEIVALGGEQVHYRDYSGAGVHDGPYGFQVMSSLMRYGQYDKDFLDDYGRHLIDFEKKHKDEKPADLWRATGDEWPNLNFGSDTDYGFDPMVGYMEALGHNPEAAKDLFYSEDWAKGGNKVDPDLKYLMVDRSWPNGNPLAKDDLGYGYDELGHALQAATLGVPYDQLSDGVQRDAKTANVMEQVVRQVGADPNYLEHKPNIGESLAVMGAAYLDDLNWSLSNFGDDPEFQRLSDAAYHHDGPGHMGTDHQEAISFISTLGQDKDSYNILSTAQRDFTIGALKAHPDPDDQLSLILETGSKVNGALDESRASGIHADFSDKRDDYSDALSDAAEWKKYKSSQGINAAFSIITMPLEGAGKAASFVIPSLTESISGALETQQSIEIDQEVRRQEDAYKDKLQQQEVKEKGAFLGAAQNRAMTPLSVYVAAHPELRESSWYLNARRSMEQGYNNGVTECNLGDKD